MSTDNINEIITEQHYFGRSEADGFAEIVNILRVIHYFNCYACMTN